jgi:uncharacterized protein YdeI (YjbR/CyaY-like superfamily)
MESVMRKRKRFHAADRDEWRAWLERHHASEPEIWLVYAKKHTGKPSVRYAEAVEEALCFGWIDTTVNRLDDDHYIQRFTPRTGTRKWSKLNRERFRRLVKEGRMTDAGRAKLPSDVRAPPRRLPTGARVPKFIRSALAAHPLAQRSFAALAPTYRRDYLRWITEAKKPETRERRLKEAIRRLESNRKRVHDLASAARRGRPG